MSADFTKMFPTIKLDLFQNANSFIKCWSKFYNYSKYEEYIAIVTKSTLTTGDLRTLFEWKNGMNLSSEKENSFLVNVLQHEEAIYDLKRDFNYEKFENTFKTMSAIWQIFLLHIIRPLEYPIFDQHVYRAYRYIQYQDEKALPFTQNARINVYCHQYRPFFLIMKEQADERNPFETDRAMWAFGKFIKEYSGFVKINF